MSDYRKYSVPSLKAALSRVRGNARRAKGKYLVQYQQAITVIIKELKRRGEKVPKARF